MDIHRIAYKSPNNFNVIYKPLAVTSHDCDAGTKVVLVKTIMARKKVKFFNLFTLFSFTKKINQVCVYWKPRRGIHANCWLLLKKNYNSIKNNINKVSVKYKVKSKRFHELLNKIEKNEKSIPTKS